MKTHRTFQNLAAALCLALAVATTTTRASVPAGPPVFTTPLEITNAFHPFQPGGIKVFNGYDDGHKHSTVYDYTTTTRTFQLAGKSVECRMLREMSFEDGKLIEISFNYFAQADDGSVYYFGETVNIYENGVLVNHDGSWLVGGPVGNDPPETATATVPGLIMPANPEIGDSFKPEDLFPIVDETSVVTATGLTLQLPAGSFTGGIKLHETSLLPGNPENKTYVPGVGEVLSKSKVELQRLIFSTFLQQ